MNLLLRYIDKQDVLDSLQKNLIVQDEGKDSGMLTLSLTGEDPIQIKNILDSITQNYLAQNIALASCTKMLKAWSF